MHLNKYGSFLYSPEVFFSLKSIKNQTIDGLQYISNWRILVDASKLEEETLMWIG